MMVFGVWYMVRSRIKIIHARHTLFFIVVCLESTRRVFISQFVFQCAGKQQLTLYYIYKYIYITTWKYVLSRMLWSTLSVFVRPSSFSFAKHAHTHTHTYAQIIILSLVQHFQTSINSSTKFHSQWIMRPLLLSRNSVNNQFCFIRRCKYVYLDVAHDASKYRSKMKKKKMKVWIRSLVSSSHSQSIEKGRIIFAFIRVFFYRIIRLVRCKVIFIIKKSGRKHFYEGKRQENVYTKWQTELMSIVRFHLFYITTSIFKQKIFFYCTAPSNCFKAKFIFNAFASIK